MASLLPCWAKSAAKASRPLHFKQFEERNVECGGNIQTWQITALLCTLVISPYVCGGGWSLDGLLSVLRGWMLSPFQI